MDDKTKSQLELAKAYCYEWRLQEAYGIFRRFFDRLPFRPEKEHADYIGMFVRILLELGKEFELNFYMSELEKLHQKNWDPAVAYQLGYVYTLVSEPRFKAAKELFEKIVNDPTARVYQIKAKVMLVSLYDRADDFLACRRLIDSIESPIEDRPLSRVVRIWDANICVFEKRIARAEELLREVIGECDGNSDWYSFFSAKVSLAKLALSQDKLEEATQIISEIRQQFEKRRCKSVQYQLECLERMIRDRDSMGTLHFVPGENEFTLTYDNKSLTLKADTAVDRLLLLLVKKKFLNKESIVKRIYSRSYLAERDDKLIYYQIYALRKRLQTIGLPSAAILSKGNGYRLVPEVEIGEQA